MTAMISQPMGGLTDEEILFTKEKATRYAKSLGYDVVDTFFDFPNDIAKHESLYYLAKSLEAMSDVDAVIFCQGWEKYRGCRIEHQAATAYGLAIRYI